MTYLRPDAIVDESEPTWWYLAYFHEAGHAVAACRCNRPVNEIYIHPGNGYTSHGSDDTDYKGDDHQFIVCAGSWAEVRALWAIRGIDTGANDAQGDGFADTVRVFLRKNASDWLEYHHAMGCNYDRSHRSQAKGAYDLGSDPPEERPPDASWHALFEGMWPEIRKLGLTMLAGETQIRVGDTMLHRVGPHRWLLPLP